MSAPNYATVPASQYKCNAYVAEVIYKALGITFPVYQESGSNKFFPYRSSDWGDSAKSIPNFPVVTVPQMSDIWSDGHHTGIYLGQYNGIKVYISARDRGDGSVGVGNIQFEHGIQIKQLGDGGTFRHYTP